MFITDKLNLSSKRVYTDEGFLKVPATIGRTGIQDYYAGELKLSDRNPTDVVKVYRPPEEVFKQDSMDSFAAKAVTNNHPPVLVDSKNFKTYSVGFSGNEITRDGDFLNAELNITDSETVKDINSGKVELSNGYVCDLEWEAGVTPEGKTYDAVQRKIKGNHIAIVTKGRAGSSCKVADNMSITGDETLMKKIINGVEYEVTDQVGQAVDQLITKCNDAEKEASEMKEKAEDAEEKKKEAEKESKETNDALQAKLDDATSKIPTTDAINQMVVDRAKFVETAKSIVATFDCSDKDEATCKREIVADKYPDLKLEDKSDDYIAARYEILAEDACVEDVNVLDKAITKTVIDSGKKPVKSISDQARDNFINNTATEQGKS